MKIERCLIVLPGLGDNRGLLPKQIARWNSEDLTTYVHYAPWEDGSSYQTKLDRLTDKIELLSKDYQVSLMGLSAGGTLALNSLKQSGDEIERVITVCSPLYYEKQFTRFKENIDSNYPALVECMVAAEDVISKFTPEELNKILNLYPIFDEHVAKSSMTVPAAHRILLPIIGHLPALTLATTLYKGKIVEFLETK